MTPPRSSIQTPSWATITSPIAVLDGVYILEGTTPATDVVIKVPAMLRHQCSIRRPTQQLVRLLQRERNATAVLNSPSVSVTPVLTTSGYFVGPVLHRAHVSVVWGGTDVDGRESVTYREDTAWNAGYQNIARAAAASDAPTFDLSIVVSGRERRPRSRVSHCQQKRMPRRWVFTLCVSTS
jgi:hypothetical protein